jgi:hypothetical protein
MEPNMAKVPTSRKATAATPAPTSTTPAAPAKKTMSSEIASATPKTKSPVKPAATTGDAKTKPTAKAKAAKTAEGTIEERWGKDLTGSGWTAIPNALFVYSQDLGLTSLDIVIILHLAKFWWRKGNDPHPSKKTLAAMIGVNPRTIQRAIAKLEDKQYIKRTERKSASHGGNTSNSYSFTGLIKAAKPFAKKLRDARDEKAAEYEATSVKPATKSAR